MFAAGAGEGAETTETVLTTDEVERADGVEVALTVVCADGVDVADWVERADCADWFVVLSRYSPGLFC